MTDEEITTLYDNMVKEFGKLPDPIHEPRSFQYYVNFYRYLQERATPTS